MPGTSRMLLVVFAIVGALTTHLKADAQPITIVDTTSGTAIRDGSILLAEYIGSSTGINQGFGDVIGTTSGLHVDSDAAGGLSFGLDSVGAALNDFVVVYFDSVAGGFSTTALFTDTTSSQRSAVSGTNGLAQARIDFAPLFEADYALVFDASSAFLFQLASAGPHVLVKTIALTSGGLQIELDGFSMTDLGSSAGGSFDYVATLIASTNAFRSNEFQGVAAGTVAGGNIGASPVTLAAGDFNRFTSYGETAAVSGLGAVATGLVVLGMTSAVTLLRSGRSRP